MKAHTTKTITYAALGLVSGLGLSVFFASLSYISSCLDAASVVGFHEHCIRPLADVIVPMVFGCTTGGIVGSIYE